MKLIVRSRSDLELKLDELESLIGNTPLIKLNGEGNVYAKLEYYNLMGSIKDRPAFYILKEAIIKGLVNDSTTIIESTSGNFGIALAGICKKNKFKFYTCHRSKYYFRKSGNIKTSMFQSS